MRVLTSLSASFLCLMIRRPPRSTRTDTPLALHDALPISIAWMPDQVRHDAARGRLHPTPIFVTPDLIRDPYNSRRWGWDGRSEEHTSELQSLMRSSYAVFCLKKKSHVHCKNRINTQEEHQAYKQGHVGISTTDARN